ncbi:hypothetical protein HZB06_02460 [Candidatus Wolfebacteria bacterium]|nr:hypothetical protein [Candidatus Wolfebacteria bacterium]
MIKKEKSLFGFTPLEAEYRADFSANTVFIPFRDKSLTGFNAPCKLLTGFTLIETLITMGIFMVFSSVFYLAYSNISSALVKSRQYSAAVSVLENEIETIRKMDYADVGISGGYPAGKIPAEKTVIAGNINFIVSVTVRNVDDNFDGTATTTPVDTAPADYKTVELKISCSNCPMFAPVRMTTTVAPKNLESASNNGSLFVNVFDANGQSVAGANVSVVNNALNPAITINDSTNNNGILQLVDIPTSTSAYEIIVGKSGYSSEKTYLLGGAENPNPAKPHATVASQQVTSISFAIDKVSAINFKTVDSMCAAVPDIDFLQEGAKLIGTAPDILKYSASSTTGASGLKTIGNLEWDTYKFSNLDGVYDLSGYLPAMPVILNPDSSVDLRWVMEPRNSSAFLLIVKDGNGQLVRDAKARLVGGGNDKTFYTGRRSFSQTDWSGVQYNSQSGGVSDNNPAGEIKMVDLGAGKYSTSTEEWLISNTFDLGTSSTTFYDLSRNPTGQPPQTGADSLRIQIASNNDNSAWNFIGPDGTAGSFYSSSTAAIHSSHNNNRYLRYKVLMKTQDENFTPSLEDIKFEFSSDCLSAGQAFFNGLSNGTYALTVEKSGYSAFSDSNVSISENWREYEATLTSQ